MLRLEEGREGDGEAREDLEESSGRRMEGTKRVERVVCAAAMAKVDVRATPLRAVQLRESVVMVLVVNG